MWDCTMMIDVQESVKNHDQESSYQNEYYEINYIILKT
jgi:hypothetical protein